MISSRIKWVDVYKGILIFLMVVGHSSNLILIPWIYAFHMAGFFFISGYTTNYDKYDFITYVKKKTKDLLVPFVVINVSVFLLQLLLSITGLYDLYYSNQFSVYSLVHFFKYLTTFDLAGASWFLFVLYLVSLLSKLLYDIIKSYNVKYVKLFHLIISFVLFLVFYILFYRNHERAAYLFDLIPISLFFLSLGLFSADNRSLNSSKIILFFKILISLLFIISFSLGSQSTDWGGRVFPDFHILIINSSGGIILLSELSKIIVLISSKLKLIYNIFNYLGQNTIEILKYHFLSFRIVFTLLYLIGCLELSSLKSLVPPYNGFIETLGTAIISVIVSLVIALLVKHVYKIIKFLFKKLIIKISIKDLISKILIINQ